MATAADDRGNAEGMSVGGSDEAERSVRATTNRGIEVLARLGYAAKGIVYLAVGILTASAAWTAGTRGGGSDEGARGSREALSELAGGSWGDALLWIVGIGLVGYVAWRLVQAFLDPEDHGTELKGMIARGALLVSAILHGLLSLWVFRILLGGGAGSGGSGGTGGQAGAGGTGSTGSGSGGSGGSNAQEWSATLLQNEWGALLLGLAGVGVVVFGFVEMGRAWKGTWEKRLRDDLRGTRRKWAARAARSGLNARGLVFLVVGGFLVHTAWTNDPSEARGLEGALSALGEHPGGPWLMGLVALGLAAYGVFQVVKAWYRRIGPVT